MQEIKKIHDDVKKINKKENEIDEYDSNPFFVRI